MRISEPQVVKAQGSETLRRVKLSYAEVSDGRTPAPDAPDTWSRASDEYVLCSTLRPAVIFTRGTEQKKWVVNFLSPGSHEFVGALVGTYIEYFKICHDMDSEPRDPVVLRKLGYPLTELSPTPELFIAQPEEVLRLHPPAPSQNQGDLASVGVTLDGFEWQLGGFNSVMLADFTIENGNPFPIKDITVGCVVKAPSGTILGRTHNTLYQRFAAKERKMVRDFNMGLVHTQADRASCTIESWQLG